jgi:hypothetical protein
MVVIFVYKNLAKCVISFYIRSQNFQIWSKTMKKIALMLAMSLMFVGCAVQPKTKLSEAKTMKENLVVLGAYKTEIVGYVSWKDNDRCNVISFMQNTRETNKADKVVDVIMEENCTMGSSYGVEKCSCSYSGLGLKYVMLDAKEAVLWGNAMVNLGGGESSGAASASASAAASDSQPVAGIAAESMLP